MSGPNSVTDLFGDDPKSCPGCERIGTKSAIEGERKCNTTSCRVIRYGVDEE